MSVPSTFKILVNEAPKFKYDLEDQTVYLN